MKQTLTYFYFIVFTTSSLHAVVDECLTPNTIDNWKRSAGYEMADDDDDLCDSFLIKQWYRITAKSGERMPTECVYGGYRCGTPQPFWLTNIDVPEKEDIFPSLNKQVKRVACSSHYAGDCCRYKVTIEIKNCTDYLVYLLPPTTYCPTAYCFGTEIPCPPGQYSDTGFTPGCGSFPQATIEPKPFVTTGLYREETKFEVVETVKFQCNAKIDTLYTADVRWYINKNEITSAYYYNQATEEVCNALLLQRHWEKDYRPNMNVSCAIQLRQTGLTSPGPAQYSAEFMAGIIIDYREEHKILKEEGPPKNILATLTIPVGCSYPRRGRLAEREKRQCVVNLLGAIPEYQTPKSECKPGKIGNGLNFHAIKCGIYFTFTHWNKPQIISVSGRSDEKVNIEPRIMNLRLYVNAEKGGTNKAELNFWKGYTTPDLQFIIHDSDYETYSATCYSNNDPHMKTFDGRYYDFHRTEGEYILYKHSKFPVEVHGFYRKCGGPYRGALCNCGAAIRSGDSIFIANFCKTGDRENKYAIQKICDEQDMRVTGETNKYMIETMSGTRLVVVFGSVPMKGSDFYGIQTIQVLPSNLDKMMTSGLCGSLNMNKEDDLLPRGKETPVTDPEYFAESWRLKSGEEDDSLFDISNIKPPRLYARPYCTCKKQADKFPWGRPQYICNYTESLHACSKLRVQNKVYRAPCKKGILRTERDISHINDNLSSHESHKRGHLIRHRRDVSEFNDDDAPVMYAMNITDVVSVEANLDWKKPWTEQKARKHCENLLFNSPSYSVCDTNVESVNSSSYIDNCVADIRLTGESNWDGISVDNFGTTCLNVAFKVENLTKVEKTNKTSTDSKNGVVVSIFDIIQSATCPRNCSGNGECLEGQCVCRDPYFGAACDVEKTQAPKLSPRAFNGLCDISLKPCHKFIVPGLNFMEGNLTCRFKHFMINLNVTTHTEIIESVEGIYNTPFSMQCPAPTSRHKRSISDGISTFGYFMSVSNDGKNFTQDLIIIVYDSRCSECSTASLTCIGVDTCPKVTPPTTAVLKTSTRQRTATTKATSSRVFTSSQQLTAATVKRTTTKSGPQTTLKATMLYSNVSSTVSTPYADSTFTGETTAPFSRVNTSVTTPHGDSTFAEETKIPFRNANNAGPTSHGASTFAGETTVPFSRVNTKGTTTHGDSTFAEETTIPSRHINTTVTTPHAASTLARETTVPFSRVNTTVTTSHGESTFAGETTVPFSSINTTVTTPYGDSTFAGKTTIPSRHVNTTVPTSHDTNTFARKTTTPSSRVTNTFARETTVPFRRVNTTVSTPQIVSTGNTILNSSVNTDKTEKVNDEESGIAVYIGAGAGGMLLILMLILVMVYLVKNAMQGSYSFRNPKVQHVQENEYITMEGKIRFHASESK